jgi:hypothetical protein
LTICSRAGAEIAIGRTLATAAQGMGEQEFSEITLNAWEETRNEGRIENAAEDVVDVLHARGIVVSAAACKRILAQKDPKQLKIWLKKAAVATSIDDLFKSRS